VIAMKFTPLFDEKGRPCIKDLLTVRDADRVLDAMSTL
jgi:hypothetical protein